MMFNPGKSHSEPGGACVLSGTLAATLALTLSLSAGASKAEALIWETYEGLPTVAAAELMEMRGGLSVDGFEFDFGAIVSTLVDGTEVARTTISLDTSGAFVREVEILDHSIVSEYDGSASPAPGFNVDAFTNLEGFVVEANGGAGLALSGVGPGGVWNVVLNNAAGTEMSQTFEAHLTIHNFEALKANLMNGGAVARALMTIRDDVTSGF